MKLVPDERWERTGHQTWADLERRFNLLPISDAVPIPLKNRMERIKRSLRLAYYEYELVDVVMDYTLISVDLALKVVYERIEGKKPNKKLSFKELIDWAKEKQLPEPLIKKLSKVRNLRNSAAHTNTDSFGGVTFVPFFRVLFDLMNDLFSHVQEKDQR